MRNGKRAARCPARLPIFFLTLSLVAAAAAAPSTTPPPPTLLLHLSDLHFASPPRPHTLGDTGADLGALGSALRHARPAGLIITGDLTHAKAPDGSSRQAQAEWRAYRRGVNALSAGLGWSDPKVSAGSLLDLRGNHDAFAVPARGGAVDEFPAWGGAGRRAPGARVYGAVASSAGGVSRAGDAGYGSACPGVALLGVDATPTPGPAGANNFAGWVGDDGALDAAVQDAARRLREDHAAACAGLGLPQPPVLAYGHYPLATIARPLPRAAAPPSPSKTTRPPPVASSLTAAGASTYIAGHLHAVFGDRLHRLVNGSLAEVVAAAWATERAVRLIAVDGGVISFLDLRMEGGPGEAVTVTGKAKAAGQQSPAPSPSLRFVGVEAGVAGAPGRGAAAVGAHALLLTSPGDARYGAASPHSSPSRTPALRALAIPVCSSPDPETPCRPDPPAGGLTAHFTCRPSGAVPPPLALARPDPEASPFLWATPWPVEGTPSACPAADASVEVRVTSGDWTSSSPTAVVWLDPASHPRPPLTTTGLAAWAVSCDWQATGRTAFYGLWAAHFCGALLVPGMLGGREAAAGLDRLATRSPGGAPGRALAAWLLWPATALCDNAGAAGPHASQLLYALYLLVGPWGLVSPFGRAANVRALYGPAGFTWLGSGPPGSSSPSLYVPDAVRVGALHLVGAVAPCTAWIAAAASARRRAGGTNLSGFTRLGLVAGGAAAAFTASSFAYRFAWQLGGATGVLASPGLTWTWFLAAGTVCAVLRRSKEMKRG